jgi:galactonate dehydratase
LAITPRCTALRFDAQKRFTRIASMIEVVHRSPVPAACGEDYYSREQFCW